MGINLPNGVEVGEIVLPDGSNASEVIAPDGSTAWQKNAIPDTSMFESPFLQHTAPSLSLSEGSTVSDWSNQLDSGNVTAVNDPAYTDDQSGYVAVDYAADDGHDLDSPPTFPNGTGIEFSFAATLYIPSEASEGDVFWYGVKASDGLEVALDGGNFEPNWSNAGEPDVSLSYPTDEWFVLGLTIDGSNTTWEGYIIDSGGSAVDDDTNTKDIDIDDQNHSIAYRADGDDLKQEMYLYDLVLSDSVETAQSFDDYYNDRLG